MTHNICLKFIFIEKKNQKQGTWDLNGGRFLDSEILNWDKLLRKVAMETALDEVISHKFWGIPAKDEGQNPKTYRSFTIPYFKLLVVYSSMHLSHPTHFCIGETLNLKHTARSIRCPLKIAVN